MEKICMAADHRNGNNIDSFLADLNTAAEEVVTIYPIDDEVKAGMFRIEKRELIEQDRIFAMIGDKPEEDEEMEKTDVPAATAAPAPSKPALTLPTNAPATAEKPKEDKEKGKKSKNTPKTKKKDLPESAKNKLINSAALRAVGGPVKSWMLPASSSSAAPQQKKPTRLATESGHQSLPAGGIRSSRNKVQKRVTLKDALFAMENTKTLKRSDLLYKWYANIK
jgi:Transcription initiation factor TFIID component TAF4 family